MNTNDKQLPDQESWRPAQQRAGCPASASDSQSPTVPRRCPSSGSSAAAGPAAAAAADRGGGCASDTCRWAAG